MIDWKYAIFSPVPVYKINLDQVQRLSCVDQLTLCIFNSFNMKHNFYIDSMDLLHKNIYGFIAFWGSK